MQAVAQTKGRSELLSRRDELAVAFFGSWMILGLHLDGWAHQVNKPETFFSPSHLVLYSGFGAAQLYFGREALRLRSSMRLDDRLMAAGLITFVAGALGDFAWHEVFGIEADLAALLSPTHLMLMIGGLLMVTGPIRSAWHRDSERAPTMRTFFPTLVCLTLSTALVSFFLMYLSTFKQMWMIRFAPREEALQIVGIAAILVTNAILLGSMLLVLRRWTPRRGTFTFLFGVSAVAASGLSGFHWVRLSLAAVVAGLVADELVQRRVSVRIVSLVVPLVLWLAWFAVYQVTWGVRWEAELWVGSVVLAVMSGLGLSLLAFPPSTAGRDVLHDNLR